MRVPIGVVGAIAPFNFPLNLVVHKVAPAIAAGCPVVLKPASQTPFSAIALAEMLIDECGLPAGVAARRHRQRRHASATRSSTTPTSRSSRSPGRPRSAGASGPGRRASGSASSSATTPRSSSSPTATGQAAADEDPRRRVLPRRPELHLHPAGARPPRRRRRVHRRARRRGVDAGRRRPARRGDRGLGADLAGRARPGEGRGSTRRSAAGATVALGGELDDDGVLVPTVLTNVTPGHEGLRATRCSVRWSPSPPTTRSTRRSRLANDTPLRAAGGDLHQPRRRRDQGVPARSTSAACSSTRCRRGGPTSSPTAASATAATPGRARPTRSAR